jgi:hypothetical protein
MAHKTEVVRVISLPVANVSYFHLCLWQNKSLETSMARADVVISVKYITQQGMYN